MLKLHSLAFVVVLIASQLVIRPHGFVIEVDKERLQRWLEQEYGPIFNKVIIMEPVMQKVRSKDTGKLPYMRAGMDPFQENIEGVGDLPKRKVQIRLPSNLDRTNRDIRNIQLFQN